MDYIQSWYIDWIKDLYRKTNTTLFVSSKLSANTPSFYDPQKDIVVISEAYHQVYGYVGFAMLHELGHALTKDAYPCRIRLFNEFDGGSSAERAANEKAIDICIEHHFNNDGRNNWKDVVDIYDIPSQLEYLVEEKMLEH